MAATYDYMTGEPLSEGLQGSDVCDQAIQIAQRQAREYGVAVLLEDDDGSWKVNPDGSVEQE